MTILLIYLSGFLLWMGLLWFDSFWQIPFFALLVGSLFHALFLAANGFRQERKRGERFYDLLPLCIVLLSFATMFCELTDWKVEVDHFLFEEQRIKFIEELRRHESSGTVGMVKLPHWWLSGTGEAEVFDPSAEHFIAGFPVRQGSWIVVYTAIDIVPTAKELLCGEVISVRKLSPHWYYLHIH